MPKYKSVWGTRTLRTHYIIIDGKRVQIGYQKALILGLIKEKGDKNENDKKRIS